MILQSATLEPRPVAQNLGAIRITTTETSSLLQRIADGDRAAMSLCMDEYGALVWSICRRAFANAADAEDAAQEAFMSLWRNADRFDSNVASEKTFVAMIARRRVIDLQRKSGRAVTADDITTVSEPAVVADDPAVGIERDEEMRRAVAVLEAMGDPGAMIIRLSVYDRLTHEQIAAKLDLPLGTVKTHIRRGLMAVRETLSVGHESEVA